MLIRIYHLIIKEFLGAVRDPKARIVLIVPPLLQLFIFSFTVTQEVRNISLGVYNKDAEVEGYSLVQRFENSSLVSDIVTINSQHEIAPLIDRQEVMGIIVIPEDFSQKYHSGQTAEVQVLLDGRRTNAAQVAGGYANRIISGFFAESGRNRTGIDLVSRNWFNTNLDPRKTTVPSLVCVLATILGVLVSGLSIARERETGTFEQLLVSPLNPPGNFGGEGCSGGVFGDMFGDNDDRDNHFHTRDSAPWLVLAVDLLDGPFPTFRGRGRAVHKFAFDDPAAGDTRGYPGFAGLDHAFGFYDPGREHADLDAVHHHRKPRSLVSHYRQRGVHERDGRTRGRPELHPVARVIGGQPFGGGVYV